MHSDSLPGVRFSEKGKTEFGISPGNGCILQTSQVPQNPGTHLAEVCRQQQKSKRGEVQEQVMTAFNFAVFSISATESKIDPSAKLGRMLLVV